MVCVCNLRWKVVCYTRSYYKLLHLRLHYRRVKNELSTICNIQRGKDARYCVQKRSRMGWLNRNYCGSGEFVGAVCNRTTCDRAKSAVANRTYGCQLHFRLCATSLQRYHDRLVSFPSILHGCPEQRLCLCATRQFCLPSGFAIGDG